MQEREWAGTTYGNDWMHKWLIRMLRYLDLRILYVFAAVFIIPFCVLFNKSGKITFRYFHRRMGFGIMKSVWNTYTNHVLFSQVVIDKFAMWAGKKFDIEIDGYDYFLDLAAKPEGFVQLSSHIGNYEIAGYTLVAETKRFNALVFWGEKESVAQNRAKMFSATNINMIAVRPDMGHLFEINDALNNGETVSISADRILGSEKHLILPFLKGEAVFPAGPFSVATMKGLKVLSVNVMKSGVRKYHIYVTPLDYDTTAPRKEQIATLSRAYVAELERMLSMYPNQWYNYFDIWKN